jgi:hypothetical protein
VGGGVNDDDRVEMSMRLVRMQQTLRSVIESLIDQAALCQEAGASGLSFSIHMVRESLAAYSKELNRTVTRYLADDD